MQTAKNRTSGSALPLYSASNCSSSANASSAGSIKPLAGQCAKSKIKAESQNGSAFFVFISLNPKLWIDWYKSPKILLRA